MNYNVGGLLVAALLGPAVASAQVGSSVAGENPESRERARAEFRAGVALARSSLYSESCAAFERSLELLPHASTFYNLAQSELSLRQIAAARYHLRRALARDAAEAELTPATRGAAAARLAELEAQLVFVTVSLPVSDARVAVDGHPVMLEPEPDGLRLTPQPRSLGSTVVSGSGWSLIVDAGPHVLELEHAGRRQLLQLEQQPGTRASFAVERFAALAPLTTTAVAPVVAAPVEGVKAAPASVVLPTEPPAATRAFPKLETAAWVLAGVGVATTAIFGSLALHGRAELADDCPEPARCPPGTEVTSRRDKIARWATVADVGLMAALLGTGSAVALRLSSSGGATAQVSGSF